MTMTADTSQATSKAALAAKQAELAEFLRNNLPDGAKRLVVEDDRLMKMADESGRLPVHWAACGGCLPFVELAGESANIRARKSADASYSFERRPACNEDGRRRLVATNDRRLGRPL